MMSSQQLVKFPFRESDMRICGPLVLFLTMGFGDPALSADADPIPMLSNELRARIPEKWEFRVRWRDDQLLVSVTPWPYQDAFELWYDTPTLMGLMKLCPEPADEIWKLIRSDQDIILESTVGGKSGLEARVYCRKANPGRT
jgi:hypothetical protein